MSKALLRSMKTTAVNSTLSKALEKLVLQQIGKFLDDNQVFSESQYGFRKGQSLTVTMDLLTAVVDDWLLARDKKLFTADVTVMRVQPSGTE